MHVIKNGQLVLFTIILFTLKHQLMYILRQLDLSEGAILKVPFFFFIYEQLKSNLLCYYVLEISETHKCTCILAQIQENCFFYHYSETIYFQ